MLRVTKLQDSSSDNSSSESISQVHYERIPTESLKEPSPITNFFTRILQKLVCSNQSFSDSDDDSKAIMITKSSQHPK